MSKLYSKHNDRKRNKETRFAETMLAPSFMITIENDWDSADGKLCNSNMSQFPLRRPHPNLENLCRFGGHMACVLLAVQCEHSKTPSSCLIQLQCLNMSKQGGCTPHISTHVASWLGIVSLATLCNCSAFPSLSKKRNEEIGWKKRRTV